MAVGELEAGKQLSAAVAHRKDPFFTSPSRGRFARVVQQRAVHELVDIGCSESRHLAEVLRAQPGIVLLEFPINLGSFLALEIHVDKRLDIAFGQFLSALRDDAPSHGCGRSHDRSFLFGIGADQNPSLQSLLLAPQNIACLDFLLQSSREPFDFVWCQLDRMSGFRQLGHDLVRNVSLKSECIYIETHEVSVQISGS